MQPYIPQKLPLNDLNYKMLIGLVGEANAALAQYNGMLQGVVNPSILLSPLTTQEAVLSSRIEGTQATLDEVLEHEAGQIYDEDKTADIQEVMNYRRVLVLASETLVDNRPLSLSLLKQMHTILMDSVRGQSKSPGEFRCDQNWIGAPGCPIEEASFIPPSPLQLIDHLQRWESYIESDDVDVLIQTALVHAQFELIHPFKDGNGRIGRLLIPLFLFYKKRLSEPMFYLSEFLENHRDEYYKHLQGISGDGKWNEWIAFFLKCVIQQAKINTSKVRQTLALYDDMKDRISKITHSQYSIHLLDSIFDHPIFKTSDIVKRTGIAKQTVMPLLKQLRDANVLTVVREARGRRPAILAFSHLLNIAEGRDVF